MNASDAALQLIRQHEGVRLTAYQDSVGVWTLGYGHTADVKEGDFCAQEQADAWLAQDVQTAVNCIEKLVSVPLTQNEFDALVSWTFNLGCGALRGSTLLRKLNESDYDGASLEILKWSHAGGKELPGLMARRQDERALFEA